MNTIRKVTENDLEAAGHLMESMWEQHASQTRLISKERILADRGSDYIRGLLKKPGVAVFVAETDSKIVGVVSCILQDLPSFYNRHREAYVDDLSVSADFQRQGIATKLLQACEEFAITNSVPVISAKVWEFNNASAGLMKANGLEPDYTYFHKLLD